MSEGVWHTGEMVFAKQTEKQSGKARIYPHTAKENASEAK